MPENEQPSSEKGRREQRATDSTKKIDSTANTPASAWAAVEKSRHPQRPHTVDYLSFLFSDFEELRGDRSFGEDQALVAGIGLLKPFGKSSKEQRVFVLGQEKGKNTKQKIERNFGMARPEGYRKAMRIMDLAEKFAHPMVTFVDTPGAFPGIGAEERGQAEAIASSILRMFQMKVPSVSVVIGEGGSGGALAIAMADRILMLENSTYSVISPESCAAILWGTATEAKRAAQALRMSARDNLSLGICDEIVSEGGEGAHESFEETATRLGERLHAHLTELLAMPQEKRQAARYEKFRRIDPNART